MVRTQTVGIPDSVWATSAEPAESAENLFPTLSPHSGISAIFLRADYGMYGSLLLRRELQQNICNVLACRHKEAVRYARWNVNDVADREIGRAHV